MRRDEAAQMMTDLIEAYQLDTLGWTFAWMKRNRTLGLCKYTSKELLLSTIYVDHHDRDHVEQTCLHEIAHALTPGSGHGASWVDAALRLGVKNPGPCTQSNMPEGRFVSVHSCGKRYSMHRKPKPMKPGRFRYCPPCWEKASHLPKAERAAAAQLDDFTDTQPSVIVVPRERLNVPVSAAASSPAQTVAATETSAPKRVSAPQVAAAMGVPAKSFRAWLRKYAVGKSFQQGPGGAYEFTADDVTLIVRAWNQTH